jgi:primosomal protein N' (replication factor Y)
MFVEVAVNLPAVRGTFHYHLPNELVGQVSPGHLVTAPFGHRQVQGIVLSLSETSPVPETKPIQMLLDPKPVLTPAQLELGRWLAKETLAPLSECFHIMLPAGLSQQADSEYRLILPDSEIKSKIEDRLIKLIKRRGPLRGRQIQRAMSRFRWRRAANNLVRRGVLTRTSILDPPRVRPRHVRNARLNCPPERARKMVAQLGRPGSSAYQRRVAIIETLIAENIPVEVTWLYAECDASLTDLRKLESEDLVALSEAEVWRDPLAEMDFTPSEPPQLTSDQMKVWEPIREAITNNKPRSFLLHGVTGSGKTEIYLRAAADTLRQGRGAIILVPEISLTPQTIRRFISRFPGQVGLIHSQLSPGERYDTWRRCRNGELKIVVGPRSALFTPLPQIGLIALDESHDESYKEHYLAPRYHARETALTHCQISGAVCILGSATPDVVTMYRANNGELEKLELPQRILGHRRRIREQASRLGVVDHYHDEGGETTTMELPPVRIVDMRVELKAGNRSIFSRPLQSALKETVGADQQAILFINRRGTSTFVFCRDCGESLRCPRCDTALTFHQDQDLLLCHHCGYSRLPPTKCPNCQSTKIKHFGAGTQQVESELIKLLPQVQSLRWDWDTTRSKGAHDVILAHFASHRADVLVGTQMIAKGLDLPLVTLVGVVSADTGLNLPDYRSAERTFQVLTQVAGRAGRGLLGGKVILQTYQPDNYAIQAAAGHDFAGFFQQEIHHRQVLGYPPFRRLARLLFRHHSLSVSEKEAMQMAKMVRAKIASADVDADLIGPVPCFFQKLGGEHRWQVIVRAKNPGRFIPETLPEGWIVDIDPVSLL